jgi:hypothetical protein
MFPHREILADLVGRAGVALDEHPFPLLLAAHHAAESSGILLLRRARIEKRVLLDHGVPVDCRSNLVHETLSRFLVTAGKLSDADSNAALARATAAGRLLGEMLVEEGALAAEELQRLLQQSLARKLFDLFAWRDGEARFEPGSQRSETLQRLKVARLILTGVERFAPQEAVDAQVAAFAGERLVSREPDGDGDAGGDRLADFERRVLAALAAPLGLDELAGRLDASAGDVARWVWGLALVGRIAPAGAELPADRSETRPAAVPAVPAATAAAGPSAPAPPPAAAPGPSPSAPAIAALLAAQRQRLRERVRRRFTARVGQDAFELLGLGDDASPAEIRERFIEFAREFGPWQFGHPDLAEVAEEARELFFAGAVAFAELAEPLRRESLRAARRDRRDEAVRASRASYFRIETDLLDAEAQYQKGLTLKAGGKWDLALQQFDFAVDCDSQNGTYRAEAALARFRLAPSHGSAKVIEELREAQRIDPAAAVAFLYAGELCVEMQRFVEAEGHLRHAARLLGPADRRALDALAALGQRKRKKR